MGYYINPNSTTKESWLAANGSQVFKDEAMKVPYPFTSVSVVPVCLVDNIIFTAAAVCICESERTEFMRPDGRTKEWWLVPIAKLTEEAGFDATFPEKLLKLSMR